ncbi:MAG TPA: hypothetical protein VKM35_04145 [Arenimonas sp.]|uniref:hypothetical protein n=1 Tax=Arenimonas sp. TaxID=1872635 RepID=UPI002BEAC003|nr:hypothetical protein [Arenimonas sp.]HMB56383.1 hypothetical protein [Arenimonas sp.]
MYYKIKNTLAGLTVAMSMLAVSYTVGKPPQAEIASFNLSSPGINAQADEILVRRHSQGAKRQMVMPYFSFAPILPKRES